MKRALILALALALSACASAPADPLAKLAASPAGKFLADELSGITKDAASLVTKANAMVGISPAEAQKLCGYDNIAHTAVSLLIKLSPAPSWAVTADDAAYQAIQAVCQAMDQGETPTTSDTVALSTAWSAAQAVLGTAKP